VSKFIYNLSASFHTKNGIIHHMTEKEFHDTLALDNPPNHFDSYWTALWHIYKDDWQSAHDIVDGPSGSIYYWVFEIKSHMIFYFRFV